MIDFFSSRFTRYTNCCSQFGCTSGIAERAISSMAGLQPQIEILEKRITNDANNVNIEIKKSEERNQILQERLLVISNSIADVTLKLEKSNTAASKLTLNVDEIERKSNNMLSATEVRLRNEVVSDREEMKKKFQTVQVRITSETERIQNEIIKSALNASTISRRQFEDTLERIENTKKSLFEELERKCSRIQENSEEESSALKQKFKNQCASLDSVVDQMQQNTMITPISGTTFYSFILPHVIIIITIHSCFHDKIPSNSPPNSNFSIRLDHIMLS